MKPRRASAAFTLLELLVVVGLIAGFSFLLFGALRGGGRAAALQSGQATLANLVAAARTRAMASGESARLLIHVDPGSPEAAGRYLRYLALQVQSGGVWPAGPVAETFLPEGVWVVPGNFPTIPAGLFAANATPPWTKPDGSPLRSTALRAASITSETINSSVAEQWVSITFAASGTTAQSGDLILALGQVRPPGSSAPGESPVELGNAEQVRGLALSVYGVPVLVGDRAGF
jgi:type II secretory pathway pseudopilin PulG